jgi:hypothetical protein
MVVDPAHNHVFVSTGDGGTSLFVLDYDGTIVKTITGLSYPTGMAVDEASSILYVAQTGGSSIATVDTSTLEATGDLSVAPGRHRSGSGLRVVGSGLPTIASLRQTPAWRQSRSTGATCRRRTVPTSPTTAPRSRPRRPIQQ